MSTMPNPTNVERESSRPDGGGSALATWMRANVRTLAMAFISLTGMIFLWHMSSRYVFNPILVPTPGATLAELLVMLDSGELAEHVGVSLKRILVGFISGSILGIVFGTLIGHFRPIRELADPIIELIRPISPVALVPLSILWFGIGETSRYFVIFYATIIVVMLNTAAGVSMQPQTRLRAAQCLGASAGSVFFRVVLPSAVPQILTGMRIAVGFSFMGVVAAEMIGANSGIGYLIMQSRLMILPERMFVGFVSLSIIGLLTDRVFRFLLEWSTRRFTQYQVKS